MIWETGEKRKKLALRCNHSILALRYDLMTHNHIIWHETRSSSYWITTQKFLLKELAVPLFLTRSNYNAVKIKLCYYQIL